ncbi:hypothetical protein, partial [Brevundimonas sp.]
MRVGVDLVGVVVMARMGVMSDGLVVRGGGVIVVVMMDSLDRGVRLVGRSGVMSVIVVAVRIDGG